MTTTAFYIDDIFLMPQPTSFEWSRNADRVVGQDGEGKPIKAMYRTCLLSARGDASGVQNWTQFDDGDYHEVTLPAPATKERWTDYVQATVDWVDLGPGVPGVTVQGLSMQIGRIVTDESLLITESDEFIKI